MAAGLGPDEGLSLPGELVGLLPPAVRADDPVVVLAGAIVAGTRGECVLPEVAGRHPGWLCWREVDGDCWAWRLSTPGGPPPRGALGVVWAWSQAHLEERIISPQTAPIPEGEPWAVEDLTFFAGRAIETSIVITDDRCAPGLRVALKSQRWPVTPQGLVVLGQVAGLGAELARWGWLTYLRTAPMITLTVVHPQVCRPLTIGVAGDWYVWGEDRHRLCDRWKHLPPEAAMLAALEMDDLITGPGTPAHGTAGGCS